MENKIQFNKGDKILIKELPESVLGELTMNERKAIRKYNNIITSNNRHTVNPQYYHSEYKRGNYKKDPEQKNKITDDVKAAFDKLRTLGIIMNF